MKRTAFQIFIAKWKRIYKNADMSQWSDVFDAYEAEFRTRCEKSVKFYAEYLSHDKLVSDFIVG